MAIGEKLEKSVDTIISSSPAIVRTSNSAQLDGQETCPPPSAPTNFLQNGPLSMSSLESWWTGFRPVTGARDENRQTSRQRRERYQRSGKASSLSRQLTVVLAVATLFAYFPNSVVSTQSTTPAEEDDLGCFKGFSSSLPGATYPRGDIFLKEGDSLEIFCKLDLTKPESKGFNASNIEFVISKANISSDKVVTTVLNETTAVVRVNNLNASAPIVQCRLTKPNERAVFVCQNQVEVGFPPLPVENFRCISHEWRNLNCSWTLPYNPISNTKYTLQQQLRGLRVCPNDTTKATSCTWGPRTDPHYIATIYDLHFVLTGRNVLAPNGISWNFSTYLGSIVIAEKPELRVIQRFGDSYLLNWTFPNFEHYKPGLEHQLTLCSEYDKCQVTRFPTKPNPRLGRMIPYFNISVPLPYAYTNYTIKVRLRSLPANDTEEFWSEPDIRSVITESRVSISPEIDAGSFESESERDRDNLRDIQIWWKSVPDKYKNGPNFKYDIEVYNDEGKLAIPQTWITMTDSYAKFENLNTSNSYIFKIATVNSVGRSVNASEISVPSVAKLPHGPKSVSKIDLTNGSFEISWKKPDRYPGIVSYTVFRCASKKPRPYPCEGRLEWERVEATSDETIRRFYNFPPQATDRIYQFAVSATTEDNIGSGMVWASCIFIHDKIPQKLRIVRIEDVSEDEILIKWDIECSYQSKDIEGFKIFYCQVDTVHSEDCRDNESQQLVQGASTSSYRLKQLKPSSTYKILVSILTTAKRHSPRSDPVYAHTLEGAPSHPTVSKSEVTNDTAKVFIKPPEHANGLLKDYKIYYRSSFESREQELREEIQIFNETLISPESITLTNLSSNTNYTVRVIACTLKCSEFSPPAWFLTDIGHTDLKEYPVINADMTGGMVVEWNQPDRFGGPIDHFEIKLTRNGKQVPSEGSYYVEQYDAHMGKFYHSMSQSCEPSTNFTAQVRAVTKLVDGNSLFGAWTPPAKFKCGGGTSWLIWMILVFVALAGAVFLGYLFVRFYHYFRHMKEVPIKLPPGLNSELNGFAQKPPPRSRSSDQSYGKENFSYPLQPTSSQLDESKDFLSSSELNQGEAEESLIEKPMCPSPTNPLLGGMNFSDSVPNLEDDEADIRLSDFNTISQDRCSSPAYKKLGVMGNGSVISMEPIPGPSSRSTPSHSGDKSSPSHVANPLSAHSIPSSMRAEPSTSNGINRTVPDVLSSSPSSPTVASPAPSPAPPIPPPSSSYVKWTTLVPDMKTGDVGGVLDNGNRQSPYCQVGILLDS